jgi:MoaA/NifB/PqqE/SkfB family radical SAM enzyme
MPGLLDVILGYDCNLACDYCTISPAMRSRSLSTRAVVEALRGGRLRSYDRVAFTGGEPTIRADLLGLIKTAVELGYEDVKVQSNGLLYSPTNVDRLVAAGVSRFHVSIHTHEPAAYDALVRRDGAYPLMVAGLRAVVATSLPVVVDLIIKQDTYARLPAAVDWIASHGVGEIHLWYVSLTDHNAANVDSLPAMTEALPSIRAALAQARAHGVEIKSLHVPRCLLADDCTHAWDPGAQRVLVVTPDATFELEDSRLAGQVQVPACAGCQFEALCPGVRPDYLARYGDGEIAATRGQPPSQLGQLDPLGRVRLPLIK